MWVQIAPKERLVWQSKQVGPGGETQTENTCQLLVKLSDALNYL